MAKKQNKTKISYEPEADVLVWEMTGAKIDHAREIGDFVVHFDKESTPVLVEILEASKFFKKAGGLIKEKNLVLAAK